MRAAGVLVLSAGLLPAGTIGAAAPATIMNERQLAQASNELGFDLYGRVRSPPGNLVFSPASISTALVMAWAGARGTTAAEMKKVLRLQGEPAGVLPAAARLSAALQDPARPVKFRIANRLFTDKAAVLEAPFVATLEKEFGAALERVDFRGAPESARDTINRWVEERTEKRIRDLVPPGGVNTDTRLSLVNALYFLGDWAQPFEKESTRPAPFHLSAAQKKDVPTMHETSHWRVAVQKDAKAISLPYKGDSLSMLIVVPEAVDGLGALESRLTAQGLDALVQSLASREIALALPKFEVDPASAMGLADVLVSAGMRSAFDRQQADFTGIANPKDPRERLVIGNVFHKAFVKVDEKGTEAAAATAVQFVAAGMPMAKKPPEPFKVDRPFLFFIRDEATGLVIFMGRVLDPTAR